MLDALGNLGDFVGGIAVVATLIYLAVQVRQNTEQLRRSAEIEYLGAGTATFESFSSFRMQLASSPELAALYHKGALDPGSLDPVERLRFNLIAEELFFILATSFARFKALAPAGEIEVRRLGVDVILRSPGIAQWWTRQRDRFDPRQRDRFDPEFVDFIDAQIAIAKETPAA